MKKFKRKWKGSLKRAAAIALAVLMVSNTIDMSAFAVSAADETQTVLCEHHTEHTAECGYSEGTEEVPCTHVHGEECSGKTEECSAKTEECVHTSHDASCGYSEAQEGSSCTHEHEEACGEEGAECTHTEHTSDCGYAEAQEGSPCTHECSEENGCIIVTENCTHTGHDDTCSYGTVSGNVACSHEHDDTCGYVEAKEGTPCNYVCEICIAEENNATIKTITAWSWIETEGFEDMIDSENVLPLVGVNERNPVDLETLLTVLPAQITATIGETEETVTLSGWSCADFPAEGAGSGSYVFTANLPEGYELAEDVPALTVTVELGGAVLFAGGTYDFSTNQSPLTINSSNKDQYDGATITGSYTLYLGSDILVIDGVTVNLTIDNLALSTTGANTRGYSPIDLRNNATLNLTVKGTNTLTAEFHAAGIHVPEGCTLNITSASTGTLTVNGGGGYGGGAGIGADGNGYTEGYGSTTQTCGTINIAGGTIVATGGGHYFSGVYALGGAGIGGSTTGDEGGVASTGKITISGGNVTATGGGYAAGIGGGHGGYIESIEITGGTVTAIAEYGAAIGSGIDTSEEPILTNCPTAIAITGGTVTADGNIGYGGILYGTMSGGSLDIGTDASVALTDGHKIDHDSAGNYAIIPVTLNVYDGRLTDTTEWVTMNATKGGSRIGGAGVELAVSNYHGTGKVNFVVPVGNATGATDFTVTWDGFTTTGSATLTTSGVTVTVTIGKQLYPVTLTFLDDTKFASDIDYTVSDLTVTTDGGTPAEGTIMATLPNTIEYHSASMGTMVVWLAAGTYDISVTQSALKADGAMTGNITVTGSTTLNLLNNSSVQILGNLDLSYGPIKFYKDGDAYKVDYYATADDSEATTATVLVSAPFVVTQSGETTTNTITVTDWSTAVPLDLTIDGLNVETSTALSKDDNAGHIDINGSAVNLNLSGSSSLKSTYETRKEVTAALVSVDGSSSLTIDGTGSLTVYTNAYGAAIGGDYNSDVGSITIKGGTVDATSKLSAAAIGTGYAAGSGGHAVITIEGGTVNATVGYNNYLGQGTAIGAAGSQTKNANTASVTITGGEVNATGVIGASNGSATVEITGGTVKATANTGKATIGGVASSSDDGTYLSVTISGGTVNVANTGDGPAIGGSGNSEHYSFGTPKNASVTINGGTVTAINNSATAAAIGASGGYYFDRTDVTISGGRVTATNNATNGVAIGGGYITSTSYTDPYTYSDVTITGGTVKATGIIGSAAQVAGPESTQYATVKITGGSVNGDVWAYSDESTNVGATNSTSSVYLTTATLDGANIKVTGTNLTGGLANYGMADVYTDDSSKVYFWLPEGAASLTVGEDTYKDTIAESPADGDSNELIRMKRISELDITLEYGETSYTGSQITPSVVVKDGDTTLTKDIDYTLTYGENINAGTDAGTVTITATDSSNYTGSVDKTFTITQKAANIAACAQTITYGGELDNAEFNATNLISGHTVKSVVLTASTTDVTDNGTITPSNAVIVDAQNNDVTANYKINYINGNLTINKATSNIEFNNYNPSGTYDGTALANPTADELTITGAKYSDVTFTWYTDASCTTKTTITDSGAAKEGDAPVNAGTYYVQAVIPDSTNTSGSTDTSAAITISPQSISISGATIEDVVYDADGNYTLKVTGVTFNGVVEGETMSLNTDYTATAVLNGNNAVGDGVVATVTVELKNGNYTLATNTSSATVNIKAHIHDWTYEAEGATITATCSGQGTCTVTGNTATITVNAPDANALTYNGTAKEATVTGIIDGVTTPTVVYTAAEGSSLADDKPVNAGNYTASITIEDTDGTEHKASVDFEIEKETPDIGTVTADTLNNTLDVSEVELNRTKETVAGTLELTDTTLQYGTYAYNWKFTPTGDDAVNYKEITGTVEITVSDTIVPTATYQIGTDGWKKFINTISFGLFCKDYRTVEISYSDGDNGSGIATKQYYISNEEIADTSSVAWENYTDTISLNAKGTYFIYVKVADKGGNEVILNSEGIVIYAESTISPAAFDYVYKANTDCTVQITMNGNTFAKLTDGEGNVIETTNYTIDEAGKLTLKAAYLDTLDKGEYTYKICMNPQGVETTEVTLAYTFTVNVTAKELTVTGAAATSRDYNGTNAVDITGVTLNGVAPNDAVSVDLTGLQGTLSSVNAGTYTSVTLPELTLTGADAENYTLVQPTGAVTTNVTINKLDAEITVGTDTYSKTFGDEAFTLNVTDTNDEANVQYAVTAGADVVSVSNGTVTILKAGTATITVSMPESTNYNAAVSKTITVNVAKDSYTVNEINKSYLYTRENADSINIAELLPIDCGTVSYGTPTTTGTVTYSVNPAVTDGTLSYTVESGAVNATGIITVVVETQNYEDITITVNVTLIDQIPVSLKAGTEVTLQNNTLTYGEALSKLVFNSAVFVDDDGKEVAGTLAWKEPTATPDAGTRSATWVFTPNNAEYASVEGTVAITVNKATPAVSAVPTVAERVYNPNVALADTDLTGGTVSVAGTWSWQTANVVPVVNNSGYVAVFTPNDTTNYETVTRTITVSVTKATPVITDVSGTAITYGDTLSASTLSGSVQYSNSDNTTVAGSFAWKDINVKPTVADSDSTTYAVEFTPSDTVNYNTVETTITLTVNKAVNAPNMPGSTMSVPYSNKTVSAVTLPEGWAWQDADKNTALEVGVATNATAVYVGTDKGNYENESVTVAITRSDCEHANTEVRNAKDATCEQAGYTGDTYCKDCGECTATGTEIPLADHTGGTATCTKKPVCSVCDQEYGSTDSSKHGETEIKGYVAATCTAGGYTGDTYCKDCGTKLSSGTSTGATGHDYSSEVTKEPTTTEEGVRTYTCANCKDTYTESIPKLPEDHKHNYTSSVTKEPSCTENGVRTYTCSCGDSYTEPIAKTNHSYTSEVTKEPTTTEEGVMTYTCSVCKHTYTQAIEKLPEDNKPDTEKPFIKDDEEKEGWDVIRDEVEDAKDGDTVTVDMNGTTVVPGEVFDDINGRDITIVFDMGNGITWSVNGKDITSDNVGDIDFGVKVGADANNTIPVEVINKVTGERYYMNISLSYDGEFGFKAVLSLNMDAKNAGLYAYLYYFNEQKGELEFICEDEIAADGTAELTFTHASEYTIIIDEKSMEPAPDTGNTTDEPETDGTQEIPVAPKTSDTTGDAWRSWWIVLLGAVIMIIGFGVFFVVKKKKETLDNE